MRIGIDARFYGTLGKGLGRYTEKLIKELEKIEGNDEFIIFFERKIMTNTFQVRRDLPKYGRIFRGMAGVSRCFSPDSLLDMSCISCIFRISMCRSSTVVRS